MKKIVLLGGNGTIGKILVEGLRQNYEVIVCDKQEQKDRANYLQLDATNYEELLEKIPHDTDVLVNLLATETSQHIEDIEQFNQMTEVFFKAGYYLLDVATKRNIPKVIIASSNHVTDGYEEQGESLLGRKITTEDYPYSKGLYGVLKLASENVGRLFADEQDVSVINLRIASVPKDEVQGIEENDRLVHTLLTREDVVNLFEAAVKAEVKYGTYYGVSDNPGAPWDTSNAKKELGFKSEQNSIDVMDES
ncbi:NAD-dependent epimerase/dehydratase family protein [Sutcliffiella horikoshii]|uniref:NAD-dependent epimerase/dehydratase family protein n=1 Tax=Sutcliffiella horikoshii TaxID=79883 RepID=UPI001F29AE4E|nr:NAD(P)-dependent oxidoreductase [Sutcliffiella horikoshii]MCG1021853.1 NAD(P)-dependent oxidoreductase [Sutcliffiella horikoshii]